MYVYVVNIWRFLKAEDGATAADANGPTASHQGHGIQPQVPLEGVPAAHRSSGHRRRIYSGETTP